MAGLPKIHAALAEGSVSFSKVLAMTRAAVPDNEGLLQDIARNGTACHGERFVQQYRRVKKLSEPGFARALYQRREVSCLYDEDSCLFLKARLPAEQGEMVVRALDRSTDVGDVTAATSE